MNSLQQKSYVYSQESSTYQIQLGASVVEIAAKSARIDLSSKQLDDQGLKRVLQVFEIVPMRECLKSLDLSNNTFTSVGAGYLADTLRMGFPYLQYLSVAGNSIGDNGIDSIASCLRRPNPPPCPSLALLDISNNGITAAGAVFVHRLIRRLDGMINVIFDNNPISGEGLGFIFSSKYWESFSIINTSADDSFSLFVKSTPNKSFNLKHLTIGQNHLSPESIQVLPTILTASSVPTLQTLILEESLGEEGMKLLIGVAKERSLSSIKTIALKNCSVLLNQVFDFFRVVDGEGFPMIRSFKIVEEDQYLIESEYSLEANKHICSLVSINLQTSVDSIPNFYLSHTTRCLKWANSSPQSISLILNSSFQSLALPSLKQVYLIGMHQPESSFVEALKMIPPVTKYLILENINVTPSESPCDMNEDALTGIKLEYLTVIHASPMSIIIKVILPLLKTVRILDLHNTQLTDSDISVLFTYSQQYSLLYDSFIVNTASLSEESIQLISQLTRQNDTTTNNAVERCHFCAVY